MKSSSGPTEAHRRAPPWSKKTKERKSITSFLLALVVTHFLLRLFSLLFSVPPAAPPYLLITDAGFLISFSHIA
jgi:hypothetical protein